MTVNVRVVVRKDENIERALKKFKNLCERVGIKKRVKAKRYYEKPSEARRRKARKRARDARNSRKPDKRGKFKPPVVRFLPPQIVEQKLPKLSAQVVPADPLPKELAKT